MADHVNNPNQIFISYRREDSAGETGRIYDRLINEFGADSVFKDIDSIPLGINFKQHIDSVIRKCNVVLVIIGQKWIETKTGQSRLDNPRDLVRIEVEAALQRGIPVIPVFVNNASIESEESLPSTMVELLDRNGITVGHDPHFHPDMNRLIKDLRRISQPVPETLLMPPTELPSEIDRQDVVEEVEEIAEDEVVEEIEETTKDEVLEEIKIEEKREPVDEIKADVEEEVNEDVPDIIEPNTISDLSHGVEPDMQTFITDVEESNIVSDSPTIDESDAKEDGADIIDLGTIPYSPAIAETIPDISDSIESKTLPESPDIVEQEPLPESSDIPKQEALPESPDIIEQETLTESFDIVEQETLTESSEIIEQETLTESPDIIEQETLTESSDVIEQEKLPESSDIIEQETLTESSDVIEQETLSDTPNITFLDFENKNSGFDLSKIPVKFLVLFSALAITIIGIVLYAVSSDQNTAVPSDQNAALFPDQNAAVPSDQNTAASSDQNTAVSSDQNTVTGNTPQTQSSQTSSFNDSPTPLPVSDNTPQVPRRDEKTEIESQGVGETREEYKPEPTPKPVPKMVTSGVVNSKATSLVKPAYPAAARAVRAAGAVNVQVIISESGSVISASAISGHPLLRGAAEAAARASRFSPTLLSGQPVKVSGVIVYNFVAP